MKGKRLVGLLGLFVIGLVLLCGGCAKKHIEEKEVQPSAPGEMKTGEGAALATQEKGEAEKIAMTPGIEDEIDAFENEYIYFDYDKFTLTPEAEATLSKKSRFIKARPEVRVEIQGHCDERGTTAYNMALGERRAKAARDYLVSSGIAEDILTAVSYGEERPVDPGQNEQAWAKNRRGQFVISNK